MAIEAKANKTGNETMGGSQASCDVPEPPTHLDGLALDMWMKAAPTVAAHGLATEQNLDSVAEFCELYAATQASCDTFILVLDA